MEHLTNEAEAIKRYRHYMSIAAPDLLAEYASTMVRGNRPEATRAAVEAAFEERRDEMDDYMILVEERVS